MAMCLTVAVGFTLVGCGMSDRSGDDKTPPAASSASPGTATAPVRATEASLPTGEVRRNDATIHSGCSGSDEDGSSETPRQLFDTATGKYVTMPSWPSESGDEVVAAACTVTTVAGAVRIIYIVAVKTPSQGLTPESVRTQMYSYDPSSNSPRTVKPLESDFMSIVPTGDGFYMVSPGNEGTAVTLFDADTLDVKAKFPPVRGQKVYINYDGMALAYENGDLGPMSVHFTSAVDGKEVGVFDNALPGAPVVVTDHGFFVTPQIYSPPGIRYFDSRTNAMTEPVALGQLNPVDPDNDMTALPHGSFTNRFGSQYGDAVLMQGFDMEGKPFIKVYDVKAKKEVFALSGDQLASLNVKDALIGGGPYVFLIKSPDNPVVDMATNKDVSSGWKVRATFKLDGGWELLQSGGDSADGSSRPEFTLARSESGDYTGPWY